MCVCLRKAFFLRIKPNVRNPIMRTHTHNLLIPCSKVILSIFSLYLFLEMKSVDSIGLKAKLLLFSQFHTYLFFFFLSFFFGGGSAFFIGNFLTYRRIHCQTCSRIVYQSILKDLIASESINQHICYAILIHFLVDR